MTQTHQLLITEIFSSLQGESSLIGVPFTFVRLTGCDLRCVYCDTTYAFQGGKVLNFNEILSQVRGFKNQHVLLTGGEPLLQKKIVGLIDQLSADGFLISIETHGEERTHEVLKQVTPKARIIMDVKTPGSGMGRGGFEKNLPLLKPSDEIKFVISSESDYTWARELVQNWLLKGDRPVKEILFSPALPPQKTARSPQPGIYPGVTPKWLAAQILKDHLPVRFQYQLHKILELP